MKLPQPAPIRSCLRGSGLLIALCLLCLGCPEEPIILDNVSYPIGGLFLEARASGLFKIGTTRAFEDGTTGSTVLATYEILGRSTGTGSELAKAECVLDVGGPPRPGFDFSCAFDMELEFLSIPGTLGLVETTSDGGLSSTASGSLAIHCGTEQITLFIGETATIASSDFCRVFLSLDIVATGITPSPTTHAVHLVQGRTRCAESCSDVCGSYGQCLVPQAGNLCLSNWDCGRAADGFYCGILGVCQDGSPGDPCEGGFDCLSGRCAGAPVGSCR